MTDIEEQIRELRLKIEDLPEQRHISLILALRSMLTLIADVYAEVQFVKRGLDSTQERLNEPEDPGPRE